MSHYDQQREQYEKELEKKLHRLSHHCTTMAPDQQCASLETQFEVQKLKKKIITLASEADRLMMELKKLSER